MKAIKRLREVMMKKYGICVPLNEIGYETVFLYKEEIDKKLVPAVIMDHLEGPIETESASYRSTEKRKSLVITVKFYLNQSNPLRL